MASVTIYSKRYIGVLHALQSAWTVGARARHAQLSGIVLAQFARNPWAAANTHLSITTDFVRARGIHGVDGVLLSAISAASAIAPESFARAASVAEMLGPPTDPKAGMGIFFLDLGGMLGGQGLSAGGYALTISVDTVLSGFPDSMRSTLLSQGGLGKIMDYPHIGSSPGAFGRGVRAIGDASLKKLPDTDRNDMLMATNDQCVAAFGFLGLVVGGLAGGSVGGYSGLATGPGAPMVMLKGAAIGGGLGAKAGEYVGTMVCGGSVDESGTEGDTSEGTETNETNETNESNESTETGTSGDSTSEDNDSLTCGEASGNETTMPNPESGGAATVPLPIPGGKLYAAFGITPATKTNPMDTLTNPTGPEHLGGGNFRVRVPVDPNQLGDTFGLTIQPEQDADVYRGFKRGVVPGRGSRGRRGGLPDPPDLE